jgi:AcrR family transcriptional regulator
VAQRTPRRHRRRMSAERRELLLGRLEELFLAEGFAELTIDHIAARLQCSKSTLYGVAPSKEQLVTATMKRFFREATRRVEARVAVVDEPRERIAAYLAAVGDDMRRMSPGCYDDMTAFEPTDEIYRLNANASARRVRELIHEGVSAGSFREVRTEFVAEAITLLIEGIMHGQLLERTGLSSGDAYAELSTLALTILTNGLSVGVHLFLRGARGAGVAADDGLELCGVDDVLDAGEPFGGEPFDLVDHLLRAAGPVAQHHLPGGGQAIVLVGPQRVGGVGMSHQVAAQVRGVQDGLAGAVGSHRVHRVGGVPQQGHPPLCPVRQRVPVADRELEAFPGGLNEPGVVKK